MYLKCLASALSTKKMYEIFQLLLHTSLICIEGDRNASHFEKAYKGCVCVLPIHLNTTCI